MSLSGRPIDSDYGVGGLDYISPNLYCLAMAISLNDLTASQLRKAMAVKERIEALENELNDILGGAESTPTAGGNEGGIRRRRKMSPEAREKIAAAQRARWARVNAGKPAPEKPAKGKRTMSPAAKAKIAAAARARWARVRAGKK